MDSVGLHGRLPLLGPRSGIASGGSIVQTSLHIEVTDIYLSGGIVQCSVTLMPNYVEIFSTNATVLAYCEL